MNIEPGGRGHSLFSPVDLALAVFALGIHFLAWVRMPISAAQGIWFCMGAFFVMAIAWGFKPVRWVPLAPMGVLTAVSLWSCLLFVPHSPGSVVEQYVALYTMLGGALFIVCGSVVVWVTAHYAWDSKFLLKGLLVVHLWNGIMTCCDLWWRTAPNGLLQTTSQNAFFCAVSIPVLFPLSPWAVVLPMFCLILSKSYTPLMALSLVVSMTLLYQRRFWSLAGLWWVSTLWLVVNFKEVSSRFWVRMETWPQTIQEIIQHPILGNGLDTSLSAPMVLSSHGWVYRHNDFLNLWRDFGIVAAAVAAWLLILLLKKPWSALGVSLATAAVCMGFQTQMFFPRVMAFICVLAGLKLAEAPHVAR